MLVNDVDKLKKADSELLIAYLKEPCETTVLALEGQKVAKNTRLYKACLLYTSWARAPLGYR